MTIHNIQGFAESLQHRQKALRVERSLYGRSVVQNVPYKECSTINAFNLQRFCKTLYHACAMYLKGRYHEKIKYYFLP